MRTNELSGVPSGTNVFNDLLSASTQMAGVLRVAGNQPLDLIRSAALEVAIDDLLDALAAVCNARPGVGHTFDLDAGQDMINADRPVWAVEANADDEMLGQLDACGYFDRYDLFERARIRDALASLNGAAFEVHRIGSGPLCPVGLFDHVARIVQHAVTGRSETPWLRD